MILCITLGVRSCLLCYEGSSSVLLRVLIIILWLLLSDEEWLTPTTKDKGIVLCLRRPFSAVMHRQQTDEYSCFTCNDIFLNMDSFHIYKHFGCF